jgi:hypothetical protein
MIVADAPSVTPVLITAGGAVVVALLSAIAAYRAQKRSIENQAELQRYQKDLKRLQADLDEKRADRDARRDYEYEALKRLYQECSPLLFVLAEQASAAYGRIQGLAQSAAQGNLSGPTSWLTGRRYRYYRLSTEYRLLAPLATLKLLQQRLTQFDLSLEPEIRLLYGLARQAERVICDDFELAKSDAASLEYKPHSEHAPNLFKTQPAVYAQQGVPRGILDNAIESLLVRESGSPRVMSFLEFENVRSIEDSHTRKAFERIEYLLADFHPRTRPVFWRVLLATACLYRALTLVADRNAPNSTPLSVTQLLTFTETEWSSFDWREERNSSEDGDAVSQARAAVYAYLKRALAQMIERDLAAMAQARQTDVRR